jgi:3-methyladenine DNA glycosylase AlkC
MLGVSLSGRKNKPYQVRCNNPFLKKEEHLGRYETEIQAHLVWKRKKHEHARRLASICSDERVADRLRTMYSPESDLTTK